MLPWICAPLAIVVLWRWILAPTDGVVSTLLGHRVEWLTDRDLALPVVSAVTIWTNVGYVTLFFLAGILAIPGDIQNAARTDGANAWQRFRRITLPMLRPTMFFVVVTGVISAAQVFDTVYALTAGGPQGRTGYRHHPHRGAEGLPAMPGYPCLTPKCALRSYVITPGCGCGAAIRGSTRPRVTPTGKVLPVPSDP